MSDFYDAFISYGRADSKAFVTKLYERLTAAGYRVWFDFNDIPLAVDFQTQIDRGIETSHNFLFVISPHAVNSVYCRKEIELAVHHGKRIIPLLHVEHIDRDTWQQRNPDGTDPQWQMYQTKGLHSSFPNMPPAIGKINWVYMREAQDNVEQSLLDLQQIFHRHQDYVERHTHLLQQALTWECQQKQTEYLLLGENRQIAETWLKHRFNQEQPPCLPTDLHCEFITESIKNAHNNLTQVFLAYGKTDTEIMKTIQRSLQRQGFTIWSHHTDIARGEGVKQAIKRGIEEADNVVYLLSPESLKSSYCQYLLNYALGLKKRVIPVQVHPVASTIDHTEVASLHYIDLTDNLSITDYYLDESDLIKTLNQDAAYYRQHKTLLVKALNWKRQQQNLSILLRGYDLRHGESWLKTAREHPTHPATTHHHEYIQASLDQPPPASIDVFISYSSADAEIARKLNSALQSQGKTTWFDQESIAAGTANFQREIYHGIEISDNFLFILSPRSVNSPYCKLEVDHGARFNKRFVTILHQPVNTADLHPQLATVQWLDFSQQRGNFMTHFNHLIRVLDTDRDHVQSHTKWLQRSLDWQHQDQRGDLLLRGMESELASRWLQAAERHQKTPAVTTEQTAFITASEAARTAAVQREQRRIVVLKSLLAGVSMLSLIAGVTGAIALRQNSSLKLDDHAKQVSRSLITQPVDSLVRSLALVDKSQSHLWGIRPSVRSTLRDAIGTPVEKNRLLGHEDAVWSAIFSPDGDIIASGGFDRVIRLWDKHGTPIGSPLVGHTEAIWSVAISPDGETIASGSSDSTVRLWDRQGNQQGEPLEGHGGHVKTVAFSPDGSQIASGDQAGTIRRWNRQGKLLSPPLQTGSPSTVWAVAFSADGSQLISGQDDGLLHIWSAQGTLQKTLKAHPGGVLAIAVSADGQRIASGGKDNMVRLWDRQGNLLRQLEGHTDYVMTVAFSADGQWLMSGSSDNTLQLWSREGEAIGPPLVGHDYYVYSVAFSPDGQTVLSSGEDHTLRLWHLPDVRLRSPLPIHDGAINAMAMHGPSQTIVTASDDTTVRLWHGNGARAAILKFQGHTDAVRAVVISPDGETIVSGSADNTVKLWNRQGDAIATLNHTDTVNAVAIHPTQPLLATASDDHTLRLWDLQNQQLLHQLTGHTDTVNTVVFSPDGQGLISGSDDRTIRRWDLQGNLVGSPLEGHTDDVNTLAVSPDGKMFVSASRDRTLRLWTLDGTPLAGPFNGHLSDVAAAVFSPDGQFIVSASRDQTLQLWDLNGNPVGNPLRGHTAAAKSVIFSYDRQWILSGDGSGMLRRWEGGTVQDWIRWGCDRIRDHSILRPPETFNVVRFCNF